jgi:hypothetical protein
VHGSGSSGDDSGGDGGPQAEEVAGKEVQGDGDTNAKGSQMVEGKVKVFYCKWNGELGKKGRWEKERKYEGELSVVGGYARVCSLRGRVVDTRQLMEAEFVGMEYLEKGDEMEIGKVKVVLRESWLAEESESDYGE